MSLYCLLNAIVLESYMEAWMPEGATLFCRLGAIAFEKDPIPCRLAAECLLELESLSANDKNAALSKGFYNTICGDR